MIRLKMLSIVAGTVLALSSCSKELPVTDEINMAGEVFAKQPSPGVYTIQKFIDTGDDETAQFAGYTFEFQADGDFIATTNTGAVFNGFWDMNGAETMIELAITGTEALDDLDDDNWAVERITNKGIKISAPGPDSVIFRKLP